MQAGPKLTWSSLCRRLRYMRRSLVDLLVIAPVLAWHVRVHLAGPVRRVQFNSVR